MTFLALPPRSNRLEVNVTFASMDIPTTGYFDWGWQGNTGGYPGGVAGRAAVGAVNKALNLLYVGACALTHVRQTTDFGFTQFAIMFANIPGNSAPPAIPDFEACYIVGAAARLKRADASVSTVSLDSGTKQCLQLLWGVADSAGYNITSGSGAKTLIIE